MNRKLTLALATLLLTIGFSSAAAFADSVTFTFNNANQSGDKNTTLTYTVTATADAGNGAAVFLNSDSFNLATPPTLDDIDFYNNSPTSLEPGQSATFDAFTVSLPFNVEVGATYLGSFTIQGGPDNVTFNNLDTEPFSVTITPEPSSFMLLGSGLTGLIAVARRRRSN